MTATEDKKMLNRLAKAAKHAPKGTYARMGKNGRQIVYDILKYGRNDETIIENTLKEVKAASQKVCDEIIAANKKVQNA